MTTSQICTFRIAEHLFGLEVLHIQEAMLEHHITPVPLAPSPAVRGLINLRGQIVTAIDMRVVLGVAPATQRSMNLIVQRPTGISSLLVDTIADVVEVDNACFEPPPPTLSTSARVLIRGAFKLPTEFILALDLATVFHAAMHRSIAPGDLS